MSTPNKGKCLCGSDKDPANCCLRFIFGQDVPGTAEELMRSRYTAYALEQYSYIHSTWHPDHRPSMRELLSGHSPMQWLGLTILDKQMGKANDNYGELEFEARFQQNGEKHTMKERSEFIKKDGHWLYTIGMNRQNFKR